VVLVIQQAALNLSTPGMYRRRTNVNILLV